MRPKAVRRSTPKGAFRIRLPLREMPESHSRSGRRKPGGRYVPWSSRGTSPTSTRTKRGRVATSSLLICRDSRRQVDVLARFLVSMRFADLRPISLLNRHHYRRQNPSLEAVVVERQDGSVNGT